jgi:hypothetical protein
MSIALANREFLTIRCIPTADNTDDVRNVRIEIDLAIHQMSVLAEAGKKAEATEAEKPSLSRI